MLWLHEVMRRYADPTRCPDCGSTLSSGSLTCPVCRLDLSGPLGAELFATLTRADGLLTQLRARVPVAAGAVPAPAAPAPATTAAAASAPPVPPSGPVVQEPPERVRGASVPKILLTLGAACLLVAALVFLAVTWSVLGVGGRTAVLVGLTLVAGALTAWVARRGLRGATEALGLVTIGLAVLDLYGADNAGWLGDPSASGMAAIVGVALVAGGLAATRVLSRTAAGGFTGGEMAAVLGSVMVSGGVATQSWGSAATRQLLVVCLVIALTAGVWLLVRAGNNVYRVAGWLLVPVAFLDWAALVVIGLDHLGPAPTMSSAWLHADAWPLLAAAAVAGVVAAVRRVPLPLRVSAAAVGLVPLAAAILGPVADEPTTDGIVAVAVLAVCVAALMSLAPRPWGAAGVVVGGLCGAVLAFEAVNLLGVAADRFAATAAMAWDGTAGGRVVPSTTPLEDPAWLLPVCLVAGLLLLWAAVRLLEVGRSIQPSYLLVAAGVALATAAVGTMLLYAAPVWSVLLVGLTLSVAVGWPALTKDDVPSAVVATLGLAATVVLSWYDEQLTAATVLVALALVAVMHLRSRLELLAAAAGTLVAASLAGLVWTLGAVGDVQGPWAALAGLLVLAALALGRHYLRVGLRTVPVEAVLEAAAACAAVPLALAGLDAAGPADVATWLAVYLTVAGAAATALSIVRPDRRQVAWLGGLLLAMATWVRLADLGVHEPEPYTLPSAVALLVAGLLRLRRDRSADTLSSLGAGLSLALVPSMLWVVADPTGVRALLLGLACLGLVVAGAQLRWAAPLLLGAAVGIVVVLREAGPWIGDAVPRWALIGIAGALLIGLGVTWEQRLRDARRVAAYVRGLR